MGKTYKGKAKTIAKMKDLKRKIARKCKEGKVAIALALISAALIGCQQVPSRSQTLTMRDCIVNIYGCGDSTNAVPTVEIATQAMSVENSGTETMTPTNDIKPDLDVSVPVNRAGAAQSIGSTIGDAVAGLISGVSGASSTNKTAECADGSCSE